MYTRYPLLNLIRAGGTFSLFHPISIWTVLIVALSLAGCGSLDSSKELPVACLAKPDPGPCRGAITRYFYDYRDNRCKPFRYGGCRGNASFKTLDECVSYCGATP